MCHYHKILNAKLISKKYDKLYWSIGEEDARILQTVGCNVKVSNSPKHGTTYNISTKILSDFLCLTYGSINKDTLEELCSYEMLVNIIPYDYAGKHGKSMTSHIKLKVSNKEITINEEIKK